ncbi:sialate O-acetylesterase [Paenibacillus sp. CGMCC 1.16610]|uniref:Sialate O-acetylesterase n=1 Tax=Paenibacillus anseongense TaxID=2682845 RepID=A0ABW9U4L8_9BACL|nr:MULTISPECIES: sialate O-acetylesterase [Paenibacillus]MBA2939006.1 sialate O-acetylesterase [Paenibacillus sp. CGMCC 1.16610]MVQ34968.1 sialate O-acetylesterase [Paenibacillus anseongense]
MSNTDVSSSKPSLNLKEKWRLEKMIGDSFPQRTAEVPFHRRNFNKDLYLYLCIGQSNMAGRAPIEEEDQGIIERVYLLNNNDQWEPAQTGEYGKQGHQGFNRFSTVEVASKKNGLSLALPFSKVMAERVPHAEIGIISNAVGDTNIVKWQKDAGTGLFEEAVRRTKIAMNHGQMKGILWHQGEADRYNDCYIEQLSLFVTDLRSELGICASEMPFIAGQLLPGSKYELFNTTMIGKIPDTIANSAYVSSEGTSSIGDNTHFNSESQRILGKRYAFKMLEMMC